MLRIEYAEMNKILNLFYKCTKKQGLGTTFIRSRKLENYIKKIQKIQTTTKSTFYIDVN